MKNKNIKNELNKDLSYKETPNYEAGESLANDVISSVNLIITLAFIVLFISGVVLLFVTESNSELFYIKTAVLLVGYLIFYGIITVFIGKRIKDKFKPLDKLVSGLSDDSIRIYGDTSDLDVFAEQVKHVQRSYEEVRAELDDTKKTLDDASLRHEKLSNDTSSQIDHVINLTTALEHKNKLLDKYSSHEQKLIDDILLESSKVKKRKNNIYEDSISLNNSVNKINTITRDINDDYTELNSSYTLLCNTLNETTALIDELFSELSGVQSLMASLDLYALNTSLDVARSGTMSLSVINALDEIKGMSAKLNEKTDVIAMLIIRIKNSTKLALDQTNYCKDQLDVSNEDFKEANERISNISDKTRGFVNSLDELLENVSSLVAYTYELNATYENITENQQGIMTANTELKEKLENIGSSVKNT